MKISLKGFSRIVKLTLKYLCSLSPSKISPMTKMEEAGDSTTTEEIIVDAMAVMAVKIEKEEIGMTVVTKLVVATEVEIEVETEMTVINDMEIIKINKIIKDMKMKVEEITKTTIKEAEEEGMIITGVVKRTTMKAILMIANIIMEVAEIIIKEIMTKKMIIKVGDKF